MSRIHIYIGRLVLPAMGIGDQKALVEGLRRELTRVLSDPKCRAEWTRSQRTPVLRLGGMPLAPGSAGGRKFGSALARSIGKGLKT
jgi:hypothetical protein